MGSPLGPHSRCSTRTAAAAACVWQHPWNRSRVAVNLAPVPVPGLWACCHSCTQAATDILLPVHPAYCYNSGTAAALQPTLAPVPPEGPWGRCKSRTQGATHAQWQLQLASSCCHGIPAALQSTPPRYQTRGDGGVAISAVITRLPAGPPWQRGGGGSEEARPAPTQL